MRVVLHLIESINLFGGTPNKLYRYFQESEHQHILYFWFDGSAPEQVGNFKQRFEQIGVKVYDHRHLGKNIFKHLIKLPRIIRLEKVDIVQSYFYFGEVLGAGSKLLKPSLRYAVAFVGSNNPSSGLARQVLSMCYTLLNGYMYISNYVLSEKLKAFPILQKRRGTLIYNGYSIGSVIPAKILDSELTKFLTVGGVSEIKNQIVLLKAFDLIEREEKVEWKLDIVGDGDQLSKLQKFCEENHRLGEKVEFHGYKEGAELDKLMMGADVYLHPCYVEGFGIAVIENMVLGTACIGAKSGALTEIIAHEKSGLLADPFSPKDWKDNIMRFIDDPDFAVKLGIEGRSRVEKEFSSRKFNDSTDKFYSKLCE